MPDPITPAPETESRSIAPIVELADAGKPIENGIAICLSGGGYRAMLFHAGVLWRLAETGYLGSGSHTGKFKDGATRPLGALQRVSSVSGGSIASGILGLKWNVLRQGGANLLPLYITHVVEPIRALARVRLAQASIGGIVSGIKDMIWPGSLNDHLAKDYDKHLYKGATLKSLPASPRFVINASNLQSGALWRFMSPYMRDWRVGENIHTDKVSVARAVAASSAFPPFLAPATFKFKTADYTPHTGGQGADNLQRPSFTTDVQLADGGVYDNLGLETAYKRYRTLLVSDAGAPFQADEKIPVDWGRLSFRVLSVIDNQVRSLRKRLLLNAFNEKERFGAYWGIGQDIDVYSAKSALSCPASSTRELAAVGTDLAPKDERLQERLINWGYAVSDASIRTHLNRDLAQPGNFPYPKTGV